jgi:serine protease AprX
MYNFLDKIDKCIVDKVTAQSISYHECIVYSKDYFLFRKHLIKSGKEFCEFPFISAFGIKANTKEIINFAKNKIVTYITRDTKVSTLSYIAKKSLKIDSFYAKGIYGDGGVVAIIDTGISPHLDFVMPYNRIIKFVDLINERETPYDDNGHGTMVTSLLCGNGLVHNKKYSGVSPMSKIVSIKAIEANGETSVTKILEAMQWIYNNKHKYNISVVCMSFGSEPAENYDPLVVGVESLWNSGVCVVVAAGNSGPDKSSIRSPGISRKVITVGGFDDRKSEEKNKNEFVVADFSSRGPVGNIHKPDLVAPAVNLVGASRLGGYTIMSGTSVATPLIAGIAALMTSNRPHITPDQIKMRLVRCCNKISQDQNEDGFGVIDCSKLFVN